MKVLTRREVALKSWVTRRANEKAKKFSLRAKKAIQTMKKNGVDFSKLAKKAWKTRRKNLQKVA